MAEFQRLLATGTCSPFAEVDVPNDARLEPRLAAFASLMLPASRSFLA